MKRYSTSKLKTFESCPLKYKNHYLESIELEDKPITSDTSFGSYIHKVAEIYTGDNNQEIVDLLREYPLNAEYRALVIPTVKSIIQFLNNNAQYKFEPEQVFEYKDNEIWLYGIVDRLMFMGDDMLVVDYKTSRYPNRDRHIFQMKFYNYMVSRQYNIDPSKIKCMIYYPRPNSSDKYLFSNKEIELFEKDIKKKINIIETNREWKPQPGYHCRWCQYQKTKYCPVT